MLSAYSRRTVSILVYSRCCVAKNPRTGIHHKRYRMVNMSKPLIRLLGQGIRYASTLRGGGSAFPGLVMEKLHPRFVAEELAKLPYGVVVVSGTNGKTTTTKMAVQLLEAQGLKVFTNRTGSNFVRGVAAALLGAMDLSGKLDADIAVLELDEAHAVHFVKAVKPNYALLLNVLRDQLDRFGEIDTTRRMLSTVAEATTDTVVLNREDPRILSLAQSVKTGTNISYFGLNETLRSFFPSDDEMRAGINNNRGELPSADVTLTPVKPAKETSTSTVFTISTTPPAPLPSPVRFWAKNSTNKPSSTNSLKSPRHSVAAKPSTSMAARCSFCLLRTPADSASHSPAPAQTTTPP